MSDELRIAWAAGFFDGEGTVTIQRRKASNGGAYIMQMAVFQKHPGPVFRFLEIAGCGSVHATGKNRATGAQWQWRASGRQAQAVLERLMPHLVAKLDQAQIAVAFQGRRLVSRADRQNKSLVEEHYSRDEVDRLNIKALKHIPFTDTHYLQQ